MNPKTFTDTVYRIKSTLSARTKYLCTTISESKNSWYLDLLPCQQTQRVISDLTQLPVGGRREVERSTPAIRLQGPIVIITNIQKDVKSKSLRGLKRYKDKAMYAIINLHWQLTLGSAAVREATTLAEPPIMDITDAKIHYSKDVKKNTTIFFNSFFE